MGLKFTTEEVREDFLATVRWFAKELGHTPTQPEWDAAHLSPCHPLVAKAFGCWHRAIEAAGLPLCRRVTHCTFTRKNPDRTLDRSGKS